MQTLANKAVRELAKEYFNGQLSFDDYRSRRQHLVDQLTGRIAENETEPDLESETDTTRPHRVEEKPPECEVPDQPAGQAPVCETKRFPLPVIMLLAVGGLGAAGWLLFPGDGETPQESVAQTAPVPEQAAVKAPVKASQADELVSEFVQIDDWSNEALASFVLAWSALETTDQEHVRSVPEFRPLIEGLREQILEQRALGEMADANEREAVLLSVAEHLGASRLLADLKQTIINMGNVPEPVPVETEIDTDVQNNEPQLVEVEAKPAVSKPIAKKPAVKKAVVKKAPPAKPVPPAAAKSAIKPAVKPAPKAASVPAKPVPTTRAPAKKAVLASGKDPCPASLAKTRRPVCRDTLPEGEAGPVMVVLPAGGFQMGSLREENEQPVHRVEISRVFAISAYEVSRVDFRRFCLASGRNCSQGYWRGELDPMTNVSWEDARAYVEWLTQVTGHLYRLPSEAEWEYAARAGTTSEYSSSEGDKILPTDARFNTDSPLPVNDKSVNANGFRLRHMLGNASEWVADAWQDNHRGAPGDGRARLQPDTGKRVVRGGSYADDAIRLRSAARNGLSANTRDKTVGFRVVREILN
ncbi:hypothetical protein MNBD_GAMMA15-1787 [hydrothermal vent metagenome]|uniref:Sulfatase-modifying factor enzyme-like domain-containing protein n=1 Tax=hydrothermal vent metagenome TaxID=652676 RepID=A0A3B0YRU1_9ZZZZ